MERNLNLANSIFAGFNDKNGLMICGYEWGWSKEDQKLDESDSRPTVDMSIECTFSNKSLRYGPSANTWPYDNNIKKWFKFWGHPLNDENLGSDFVIYAELSGDFPLGYSRQPTYKSLRPFDLVS